MVIAYRLYTIKSLVAVSVSYCTLVHMVVAMDMLDIVIRVHNSVQRYTGIFI